MTSRHFRLIDTVVSREGTNSPWVTVVFVGNSGETISVRLPFAVSHPDAALRNQIVGRAVQLMQRLVATGGEIEVPIVRTGRFGIPEAEV